jgi:hypothetical protein
MPLHRGTRVVATRTLGMGRVPAGSVGRVVKIGFFGGYDVNFGDAPVPPPALSLPAVP